MGNLRRREKPGLKRGFDVLENQIKNLEDRQEKNREELNMLKSFLKEIEDRLQPEEQQLKTLESLKLKLSQLETQVEGKNSEIKNSSATVKSLEDKIQKALEAEKTYEKNKQFIQLEKDLEEEKRRMETSLQQKNILETLLKRDNAEFQETTKRQAKLEAQINHLKTLEETLHKLEKEKEALPQLKTKEAELEEKLDEVKEKAVKASSEIENQERKVQRIAELGECPTCLQVVPKEHKEKIKQETGEAVTRLRTDYDTAEKARIHVNNLLRDLKKKVELAQIADKKHANTFGQIKMLAGCREENEQVNIRIEEIKSGIEENREKMAEIKETPETLARVT
jgi:exonuclease SbcC